MSDLISYQNMRPKAAFFQIPNFYVFLNHMDPKGHKYLLYNSQLFNNVMLSINVIVVNAGSQRQLQ